MHLINRKRFTLDNIEGLLKADLNPANIEASIHKQSLTALQQQLINTGTGAIESLKAFRYEIPKKDFEQLCQQNYSDLFRLKDQFQLMQQTEIVSYLNPDAKELYRCLWAVLEEVSGFLESTGIRSMAAHELLPAFYLKTRLALLHKDTLLLQTKFLACNADPELSALLLEQFRNFSKRQEASQQELSYMEQLMAGVLPVLTPGSADTLQLNLIHKLVELNFNAAACYQYCRRKILEALEDTQGSTRSMLLLTWHQKCLRQLFAASGLGLNHKYPALKELLLDFIQSEMSYQESSAADALDAGMQPAKHHKAPGLKAGLGKFQLQLSQRALAMWSQVLISMNIIRLGAKDQRRFTEFLADHFTTAGLEEILPDNFRRRYKEKHTATSELLIDILERMIRFIKQEYMGLEIRP